MPRKRDWLMLELWCLVLTFNTAIEACKDTQFECTSGLCIPGIWRCDGDDDCTDESDENPSICTANACNEMQFKCTSGICIPRDWRCDGTDDCTDGSDENPSICNTTCRADEFTCENQQCISQRWVCDRDYDCRDNSDEKDCPKSTCQPGTEFNCSDNYCIASQWRCDGDTDCPDRSDEIGCPGRPPGEKLNCAFHEFPCGDNITCIHQSWVCDGDKDCPDGADESTSKCITDTCGSDQFQCSDRSCISGDLRCNGSPNCPDESDEKNCTAAEVVCDTLTQFDCGNGSCISLSKVCDTQPDCFGWEDESPQLCGISECITNIDVCSQICVELPIGFRCECRSGYKLINNQTCEDIDECAEPGSCSQFCTNEQGGFKCTCDTGYLIDSRDPTRCKAAEGSASLLFATRQDIRKVALDRQEITLIVNNTRMATALDFVFQTEMIFWSDVSENKIYKAPIDQGNEKTVVIDDGRTTSDGLAVDWIYNHIYWTNTYENTLELANFEGNMRKTLIKDRVQEPRAIAVDPLEGWMFWTDWGDDARIERAGMDGSHRSTIISTDVKWPNGITLDLLGKKLYWVDARLHTVASCNYDGSGRRTILHLLDVLRHPFGITTFEDQIYWTDWDRGAVYKANKFTGKDIEAITLLQSVNKPMAIHVYHPYTQPDGKNQCQAVNKNCSHLCLPAPRISSNSPLFSCTCPDGLKLSSDGFTCVENATLPDGIDDIAITTDAPSQSTTDFNNTCCGKIDALTSEVELLKGRVDELVEAHKAQSVDMARLLVRYENLSTKLENWECDVFGISLRISGVPESVAEDIPEIVRSITKRLAVAVPSSTICKAVRTPSSESTYQPGELLVRLRSAIWGNRILEAKRKSGDIYFDQLGIPGELPHSLIDIF